jgi:hypothetical protein
MNKAAGLLAAVMLLAGAIHLAEAQEPLPPPQAAEPLPGAVVSETLPPPTGLTGHGPSPTPGPESPSALGPLGDRGPFCRPECNLWWLYTHTGVLVPFEVYGRVGPSFFTSDGGGLDDTLQTGIALELGIKAFWYSPDQRSAWFTELGADYIFNNGNNDKEAFIRFPIFEVSTVPGQVQELVAGREFLGVTEAHRGYIRSAIGREWYWGGECPGAARYLLGLDGGFRLGHLHVQLELRRREFFDFEPQDDQIITAPGNREETDFIKNIFIGGTAGMMIPCCAFDLVLGLRAEYSHDFIHMPRLIFQDRGLDQVKAELSVGLRY